MPRRQKARRNGSRRRDTMPQKPPQFRTKSVFRQTFGWIVNPSGTSANISVKSSDLLLAVASPTATVSSATATMASVFCSVRIRRVDAWGLNGESVMLSPAVSAFGSDFAPGPDLTKADTGSPSLPSHVYYVPRKGDLLNVWIDGGTNSGLFSVNWQKTSGGGGLAINGILRVVLDVCLSDATVTYTLTTSNSNTVTAGNMYWRALADSVNVTTVYNPEALLQLGRYSA